MLRFYANSADVVTLFVGIAMTLDAGSGSEEDVGTMWVFGHGTTVAGQRPISDSTASQSRASDQRRSTRT